MNIRKNESKMYYKTSDIITARENKKPIIINDTIKVYVECLEITMNNNLIQVRFCGDVISYNEKEDFVPSSEFKMFYSIQDFNNFVRWQRWLND